MLIKQIMRIEMNRALKCPKSILYMPRFLMWVLREKWRWLEFNYEYWQSTCNYTIVTIFHGEFEDWIGKGRNIFNFFVNFTFLI
jgi:hypothetical protein